MKARADHDDGFTLVELLLTMTILVVIAGITYSSFSRALAIYQVETKQLALTQGLRLGLSEITRDVSNAIIAQDDTNLALYFDDGAGELQNEGLDLISFVTTVQPVMEDEVGESTSYEAPSRRLLQRSQQTQEEDQAPTDVVRVAYVIGPDPEQATMSLTTTTQTSTQMALLRVTSRTLDPDDAFEDAFQQSDVAMLETLDELGATVEVAVVNARSLDFAFFDGEDWYADWDFEEQGPPRAVRAVLTVQEPRGGELTYSRSSTAVVTTIPAQGSGQAGQTGQQGGPQGGASGQGGPPGGPPQQG